MSENNRKKNPVYTREWVEKELKSIGPNFLYHSNILEKARISSFLNNDCSELIAEYLSSHPEFWDNLLVVTRSSYKHPYERERLSPQEFTKQLSRAKQKKIYKSGNVISYFNEDDWIARQLYQSGFLGPVIGTALDYQTPLKSATYRTESKNLKISKVDLLLYREPELYILKVTKPYTSKALLNSILEVYIQYRILNSSKEVKVGKKLAKPIDILKRDFKLSDQTILRPALMIFNSENSNLYHQLVSKEGFSHAKELLKIYDFKIFILDEQAYQLHNQFEITEYEL